MNCPVCVQQVQYHDYFSQTMTISFVTKVVKLFLAFSLRKDHDAAAKVEGNRVHGVHDLGRKIISMFAVATSILPHMSSTRSRRVSNAPLFVGAAASLRLSRAPHLSGGDEHPAALGQAFFFFSSGVEQPASQHVLHQKQAKRRQATALTLVASKCIYHV